MKTLSALLLFCFSLVAQASGFADCPQFFAGGKPPVVSGDRLTALCSSHFAVLHSGVTRTPVFSAERLSPADVTAAKGIKRHDHFIADDRLPADDRAALKDYDKSGYDRGHMSPDKDQPDEASMLESFRLSNMVPQCKVCNEVVWKKYEDDLRKYVLRSGHTVYVITGPIYDGPAQWLNGRVKVPAHVFKLVYDPTDKRSWAYWQDNTPDGVAHEPIGYQDLTKWIGISMLPGAH